MLIDRQLVLWFPRDFCLGWTQSRRSSIPPVTRPGLLYCKQAEAERGCSGADYLHDEEEKDDDDHVDLGVDPHS